MQTDTNPFTSILARDWLAGHLFASDKPIVINPILILGDGPFEGLELARFLRRNGVNSHLRDRSLKTSVEVEADESWSSIGSVLHPLVVLGTSSPMIRSLSSLLRLDCCSDNPRSPIKHWPYWIERVELAGDVVFRRSRSLQKVSFISQEMLLACLFSSKDIPKNLSGPWPAHRQEHPWLKMTSSSNDQILSPFDCDFPWPMVNAAPSPSYVTGGYSQNDWPQIGLLGYLGYAVGVNGTSEQNRRTILSKLFSMEVLPNLNSPSHISEWAGPNSAGRLRKMATSITAFCQLAVNKSSDAYSLAINEWQADLNWLKVSFYDGRFDFPWPDVS